MVLKFVVCRGLVHGVSQCRRFRSTQVFSALSVVFSLTLVAASQASQNWDAPIDCGAQHRGLPPYKEVAKSFDYDAKLPLDVRVLGSAQENGIEIQSIEFAGLNGARCSAALVIPSRGEKFPAVVWLGSGDKDWEPYAMEFSKLGAISFLLDDCSKGSVYDAKELHRDEIQNVVNVRRAVDILSARSDVDRDRIAFVGHSGGSMLGADAVAVDKRFKAAVLESGLQGFTYHICTSPHPFAVDIRRRLDGQLPQYVAELAPLDAILYIGHAAPTALLFQSGTLDAGVPKSDAEAFFDAASEPKRLIWYGTGHEMKLPSVTKDRTEFLKQELGMP
jgi:cephalosporin-C deacetylase-like acetyl esterase